MAAVYSDDHKFSRDLPPSPTPSSLFFAPIAVEGFKCGACVRINHVDCVTIMFLIIVIFGSNSDRPLHFPNSNACLLVVPKFSLP